MPQVEVAASLSHSDAVDHMVGPHRLNLERVRDPPRREPIAAAPSSIGNRRVRPDLQSESVPDVWPRRRDRHPHDQGGLGIRRDGERECEAETEAKHHIHILNFRPNSPQWRALPATATTAGIDTEKR